MEEPGNKKIVKREVTKVITPGTNIDEHYLNDKSNNYLGSIDKVENGFSFSYIDLSTGESFVTELPKYFDGIYNELNKLAIKEVVISSNVPKLVREYLTNVLHILISNAENTVLDTYLTNLYLNVDTKLHQSCHQLLSYLVNTQKRTLMHLKAFRYYDASGLTIENFKLGKLSQTNCSICYIKNSYGHCFSYIHRSIDIHICVQYAVACYFHHIRLVVVQKYFY